MFKNIRDLIDRIKRELNPGPISQSVKLSEVSPRTTRSDATPTDVRYVREHTALTRESARASARGHGRHVTERVLGPSSSATPPVIERDLTS